ncbi:MAG TPA: biotin/lipoyl-containing protein, partial [Vicinamibacterales bacterium]|nr:biotin/lipoyl-containing protein [Vicinamibacterales bacterium]
MADFVLPNLGDGVAQGDVLKVLVKLGDSIKVDQPVLELETDKATVEVPSTLAGVVKEIRVKAGDKVKPGQAVAVIDQG